MKYFLWIKENQAGPYDLDQIRDWVQNGSIDSSTLAYPEDGSKDWLPIYQLGTMNSRPVPPPPKPNDGTNSYANKTMQQNESPIYKTRIHKFIFVKYSAIAGLIPCCLFLFSVFSGGSVAPRTEEPQTVVSAFVAFLPMLLLFFGTAYFLAAIPYRTNEFAVTNRRVLIKVGFFNHRTNEIFVNKIESISVNQGPFGRLFDYGTVTVRGTGGSFDKFTMIAHPLEFRNNVQQVQTRSN